MNTITSKDGTRGKGITMSLERAIAPDPYDLLPEVPSFILESNDVKDGEPLDFMFARSSLGRQDISPELHWESFPLETKGFAVTCFDPDAPTGCGFWHWVLVGLPPNVTKLPRGAGIGSSLPTGAFHVRNDFGERNYGGGSPPKGDRPHRYVFAVHALDAHRLDVTEDTTPAVVGFNLTLHTLARAAIRPTFAA
jgi:Raf kinase inhibitor-like YbhB/YbcL family protein